MAAADVSTPRPTGRQPSTIWVLAVLCGMVQLAILVRSDPWMEGCMACYDSIPIVQRWLDPGVMPGDYFYNAVAHPNPRWPFAAFMYLPSLLLGWEEAFTLVLLLAHLLLPTLYYLAFWRLIREHIKSPQQRAFLAPVLYLLMHVPNVYGINNNLSLCLWSPYYIRSNSQSLCEILCLVALLLRMAPRPGRGHLLAAGALLAAGSVLNALHTPVVLGLVTIVAYRRPGLWLPAWGIWLGTVLAQMAVYDTDPTLTGALYYHIYSVIIHVPHYVPQHWYSVWDNWGSNHYHNYAFYILLLAVPGVVAWRLGHRPAATVLLLAALAMVLVGAIAWANHYWPTRPLSALSVTRFFQAEWWLFSIGVTIWLGLATKPGAKWRKRIPIGIQIAVAAMLALGTAWSRPPAAIGLVHLALLLLAAPPVYALYRARHRLWLPLLGCLLACYLPYWLLGRGAWLPYLPFFAVWAVAAHAAPLSARTFGTSMATLAAILVVAGMQHLPFDRLRRENKTLTDWISSNTAKDAVIACEMENLAFFVLQRPLYFGGAFPFWEPAFREAAHRHVLTSYPPGYDWMRIDYRDRKGALTGITPTWAANMARHYRLDYVLFAQPVPPGWQHHRPLYQDHYWVLYRCPEADSVAR